jgi:hypothetical protein
MNRDLEQLFDQVKTATGYPVTVSGDSDMGTHSRLASASPQRPVHTIFVNPAFERFGDYLVAVQCAMLVIKWANPAEVVDFIVRQEKLSYLIDKFAKKSDGRGMPRSSAVQYATMIVNGLLLQLNSLPLQMMSIEMVHRLCPSLADQGRMSGRQELQDMSRSLSPDVRAHAPDAIFNSSASMNAAFALFWSKLAGDTVCILPYKVQGFLSNGQRLLAAYEAADQASFSRHRDVVDAWAKILSMETWYQWRRRDEA